MLEFALAVAAQQDDYRDRELGPIHLIKYVYIADLAFAERNKGQTFTGIPWRFYHFGPWANEVHERIPLVVLACGAETTVFENRHIDSDTVRYRLKNSNRADELERLLDPAIVRALKSSVKEFGKDTGELLNQVYLTAPMLHAAPNEILDFATAALPPRVPQVSVSQEPEPLRLSEKNEKRRKKALEELRSKVALKLEERRARRSPPQAIPPRYDSLFFEGVSAFDNDFDEAIVRTTGVATVGEGMWTAPSRSESDVS